MKKTIAAIALTVILSGCGSVLAPPAARVGGHEISAQSVTEALDRFEKTAQFKQASQQASKNAVARQYEQSYLARIIRRFVLQERARRLHVVVSNAEVQAALTRIEKNFPSQGAFEKALEQQGLTLDQLGPLVRDQVLEQKLRAKVTADVTPSTQELRDYYQQHLADHRQVLVSHILVAKRAKAQQIADRLHRTKPADVPALFSKLARSESTDKASAAKGGELGPLTAGSSSFVPPFQKAAEALKPGEVSQPVHSKFGWHVIFVQKHLQSFNEARAQIAQQVAGPRQNQEWQRWVISAYRDAHVNVNPSYGTLDLNTQTIVDPAGSFPGAARTTPPAPSTPSPPG